MKNQFTHIIEHFLISLLAIGVFLGAQQIFAWTNPGANPPGGPVYIATLPNGNVGIGQTNPGAKLEVNGQIKITGGTPAVNEVLTTVDGSGLATWEAVPAAQGVPSGLVAMWYGTIASIPSGWRFCDGTAGTPNLQDRFILGVTSAENPLSNITGGTHSYSLTVNQLPGHTHNYSTNTTGSHTHTGNASTDGLHGHGYSGATNWGIGLGTGFMFGPPAVQGDIVSPTSNSGNHGHMLNINAAGDHAHSGTTDAGNGLSNSTIENRPLFFKLAYICKT